MNNAFYVEGTLGLPGKVKFELIHLDPIAIGTIQPPTGQSDCAIAIGKSTGLYNQGECAIAIGKSAGQTNQGLMAIAMGARAGSDSQVDLAIAVGVDAGSENQSTNAVAFGKEAGMNNQSQNAIAIGTHAGRVNQDEYTIALGAYAGHTSQHAQTVVINATGAPLNTLGTDRTYLAPLRSEPGDRQVQYNLTTKEIVQSSLDTIDSDLTVNGTLTSWKNLFTPNTIPTQTFDLFGFLVSGNNYWSDFVSAPNGKVYGIPFGTTWVLVIDPVTNTTSGILVEGIKTQPGLLWLGGVLAPNGKIYGIPRDATQILVIDPVNNTATLDPTNVGSGTQKWSGGTLGADGKIYGIPTGASSILIFDPITGTVDSTSIGGLGTSLAKWNGASLGSNGKIYGMPSNNGSLLILDPSSPISAIPNVLPANVSYNNTTRTLTCTSAGVDFRVSLAVGDNLLIVTSVVLTFTTGYVQHIVDANNVILVTALGANISAGQVSSLQKTRKADITTINASTATVTSGRYGWSVSAPNGKIYATPYNAPNVLIVDPNSPIVNVSGGLITGATYDNTTKVFTYPGASFTTQFVAGDNILVQSTTSPYKFTGFVDSITDNTNLVLLNALGTTLVAGTITSIQKTRIADITTINTNLTPTGKWNACALGSDGKIYASPANTTSILVIDPGSNTWETIIEGLPSSSQKYYGVALASTGKLYASPYNFTSSVLIIDPSSPVSALTFTSVSYTDATRTLNGVGTLFLSQLTIGDNVLITASGGNFTGYVESITNDTTLVFLYALGASVGTISSIQKTRKGDLATITFPATSNKFAGGVLAPNGNIYCIPYSSTQVGVIDTVTKTFAFFSGTTLTGTLKWYGGVLAPNGKIYGIPYTADTVLIIDPITSTVDTTTISVPTGSNKWMGGVLGLDGKIYGIPNNSTSVLIIDPVTNTADTTTIKGLSSSTVKWGGGVLAPNGKIYCMAYTASSVLIIDPSSPITSIPNVLAGNVSYTNSTLTLTCTSPGVNFLTSLAVGDNLLIQTVSQGNFTGYVASISNASTVILSVALGTDIVAGQVTSIQKTRRADFTTITGLGTSTKSTSGVLGPNGLIYVIPRSDTVIRIINPVTNTFTTIPTPLSGTDRWNGGVLGMDGKIYCLPGISNANAVLIIDPATNTTNVTTLTAPCLSTSTKFLGGVLAPDGTIYGIPNTYSAVIRINPGLPTIPGNWMLSAHFNKY